MKTYRATKDISIDGYQFKAGDTVGQGEIGEGVGEGQFTPVEGCPRITVGHVQARMYRGLITTGKVDPPAPDTKPAKATTKTKSTGKAGDNS
jgi:hypothetical protein